ncbi:MAG: hypothetical protein HQL01_02885 [Nitrospirae bacterium]|nr:hypothetical protein [Nitrospirota bacterium]
MTIAGSFILPFAISSAMALSPLNKPTYHCSVSRYFLRWSTSPEQMVAFANWHVNKAEMFTI